MIYSIWGPFLQASSGSDPVVPGGSITIMALIGAAFALFGAVVRWLMNQNTTLTTELFKAAPALEKSAGAVEKNTESLERVLKLLELLGNHDQEWEDQVRASERSKVLRELGLHGGG